VGDALYGNEADRQAPRLLLHASALMLAHPISGLSLHFESPPPF
jgi:tRNA pseudouridine32 synthase/23S rRNA pseudouridine746 synthase